MDTECEAKQTAQVRLPEWAYRVWDIVKHWFVKRPESNYIKHAKREFQALGYDLKDTEDGPNKWIMENVFELLNVFGKQGHSGFSAPYCVRMFQKMALFEPVYPLTGEESEWNEVVDGVFQNNRCSHVFKDSDGKAYDIDGRIFRDSDGCCYTSRESRVYIDFPYTPKSVYVDVPKG